MLWNQTHHLSLANVRNEVLNEHWKEKSRAFYVTGRCYKMNFNEFWKLWNILLNSIIPFGLMVSDVFITSGNPILFN
jgi:hypothetical protein